METNKEINLLENEFIEKINKLIKEKNELINEICELKKEKSEFLNRELIMIKALTDVVNPIRKKEEDIKRKLSAMEEIEVGFSSKYLKEIAKEALEKIGITHFK